MSAQLALKEKLLADPIVAAIVGTRITPMAGEQDEWKEYITFLRVDGNHEHHLTGASGLVFVRVQLNLFSEQYVRVLALSKAVRECLDGFPQRSGDVVTVNGVVVRIGLCNLQTDRDTYEEPVAGERRGRFGVIQDYLVGEYESVPPGTT